MQPRIDHIVSNSKRLEILMNNESTTRQANTKSPLPKMKKNVRHPLTFLVLFSAEDAHLVENEVQARIDQIDSSCERLRS